MNLRFLLGYWDAWKILPLSGKGLLIVGYLLSAFIYWSATAATVSPNAECLTGLCMVTQQQVEATHTIGIFLLGAMTVVFILALTSINIVMEKHPEKATKLLRRFAGVSTQQFWQQVE